MSVNGQETRMTIHRGREGRRPVMIYGSSAEGMPRDARIYEYSDPEPPGRTDPEAPGRTEASQASAEKRGVQRIWSFLKALIPSMDPASRALR